jgi:hypothetical protein
LKIINTYSLNQKLIVMKKISSSIAAIFIFATSYSQSGYSYEIINSEPVRKQVGPIASDPGGNTIISGQFETTITFGGITLTNNNPSPGSYNTGFVAKELSNGSFGWAKMLTPLSISNGSSYVHINGICTDAAGNVYLTGEYIGKMGCDNVTVTSTKNGSLYTRDIFVFKLSANGNAVWGRSIGTANDGCNASELGRSITVDNAGNVIVGGQVVNQVFKNTTVCREIGGPGCSDATSKSVTCPIVIKYNAVGTKLWEKRFPGTSAVAGTSCYYNHPGATDVRTDGDNIYVTGYFYGTTDFGNGTLSTGSESTSNVFLAKLNANGTTLWSRQITGGVTSAYSVGDGLFVNGNDIYVRGIFNAGTISLGGCSLTYTSSHGFLAKVFSNGNCSWMQPIWGISYGTVQHPDGNLAILLRKTITVSGWYDLKELSPVDGSAVDSTVADPADTATANVYGYPSIASLPNGFVFSQMMAGTYDFADLVITSSGNDNMVLIRYTTPAPPVANRGIIQPETSLSKLFLYPNPATDQVTIQNSNNKILGDLVIYDASGKMIYKKFVGNSQTTIDVKNFSAGVYYLRSDQIQTALKFVKR